MTKQEIAEKLNAIAETLRIVHDAPPVVLHQAHDLEGLAAEVVLLTDESTPELTSEDEPAPSDPAVP